MPATVGGIIVQNPEGRFVPFFSNEVYSVEVPAVTLAQLNAGLVLIAATPDVTYKVVDFDFIVTGAFAGATDIRISDTTAVPVDVVTAPIAGFTNGAFISPGSAGVVFGVFGVGLTANQGIQLRKTGGAATGGTSIKVMVRYKVNA